VRTNVGLVAVLLLVLGGAPVVAQSVDVDAPRGPVSLPSEDEAAFQRLIERTVAGPEVTGSLDWFWSARVRPSDGSPYAGVSVVQPYRTGERPDIACDTTAEQSAGNAAYCALDHALVYDLDWLRSLYRQVGPAAPVTLLAHEFGHHIGALQGSAVLSVRRELQADCYAGMFIRALVDNGGLPLDGFTQSLRLFASIGDDRDGAPTSAWSDPEVHGTGVQRREAEGVGYEARDMRPCLAYTDWAEQPPIALGGDVTLQLPPGVSATFSQGVGYVLTSGGARASLELSDATGEVPGDVLGRAVRARYGDSASLSLVPGGFLDARGWATGSGARATFTGHVEGATGVAAIQSSTDGVDRTFMVTSDDGDPRTADAFLDGLLWGYCDLGAVDTANCGTPSRPAPTARPTARPDSGTTGLRRADIERLLIDVAPTGVQDTCKRFRDRSGDHDPFSWGAFAAITCAPRAGNVEQFAMFAFPDQRDLDAYFDDRIGGIRDNGGRGSCLSGYQEDTWAHGRMFCWISRTGTKKAHIRWTDERAGILGLLDADDRDLAGLKLWWWGQVAD
jgi:hypothetical protein